MKKTFKFTVLLCLTVVIMLAGVACKQEPSTPQTTTPTPTPTTPEETTTQEPIDPDKPEGAVLVDSINGKSVRELLEQFAEDFSNAESYDLDAAMSTTVEDIKFEQFIKLRVNSEELEMLLETDGIFYSVYFVDGTIYVNTNGEKIKMPATSIDDMLGEDVPGSLIEESGIGLEFSEAELEAAADANIYLFQNRYVVTIHTFNEEEEREETSMFYFNAEGELTSAACYFDGGFYMLTLTSYNKPVEIAPPADADKYLSMPKEDIDPPSNLGDRDEIYAIYKDVCATLQGADHFSVFCDKPGISNSFYYDVAGKNKSLMILEPDGMLELWYISHKAYVAFDGGDIYTAKADNAFFSYFKSAEEMFPFAAFALDDMQNLRCSYDATQSETVIEFDYVDEFGILCQYKYALADDGSYINISVTEFANGTEAGTYTYFFEENPDLKIVLPETY